MTHPAARPSHRHHLLVVAVLGVLLGCAGLAGAILEEPAVAASAPRVVEATPAGPDRFAAPDQPLAIPDPFPTALDATAPDPERESVSTAVRFDTDGPVAAAPASPEEAPEPLEPERVVIPDIGVDASLVELGLDEHGAMELPDFGLAGWYTEGPAPGEVGPAVIVAHVDDQRGPDVFFELQHLEPGAEVHVPATDGSIATFVVEHLEILDKEALPVDRIWAPTAEPGLTLITCGGDFDRRTGHYKSNVIVYTSPA